MEWLLLGVGLVILLLAGDALVKGAVNTSLRIGIPALIVSLTVVAFGTSAPELLISIEAVLKEKPGLALGNVIGSNIANSLLVVGVPALIATMHTSEHDSRRSFVQMLTATFLFMILVLFGRLTFLSGLVLLGGLAWMLWDATAQANNHKRAERARAENGDGDDLPDVEGADPHMSWWKILLYLALGLVGLPLGANLMVENAATIAERYGVSDAAIGLTLVALGTSLPELATTVMAALRRQADVALGNVIGSNMFNLLGIIGVTALVRPIPVDPTFLSLDIWVMLAAALTLIPFVYLKRDVTRIWGLGLTAAYVAYIVVILR